MRWLASSLTVTLLVLAGCAPRMTVVEAASENRGRLLYDTACVACHTTQAHWRGKSVVHSWSDLVYQVTRWQQNAGQQWTPEEIVDVAAYLNGEFYRLPCPVTGCGGRREISLAR